jgi:hypothetical protein
MVSLTQRYDNRIAGVLSCYDRVVVTGTLPTVCYAEGMTRFRYASGIVFSFSLNSRQRCVTACVSGRRALRPKRGS